MRFIFKYISGFVAAVLLCGCNNEAFIGPLIEGQNEHAAVACGGSLLVKFCQNDWDIYGFSRSVYLSGDIYNIDGLLKES